MCDIYSNATITISADGSLDCQCGCFVWSPYPCLDPGGGITNIYLRRLGFEQEANGSHATEDLSRPRLDTRGWTLQERLLSPRVLHCTSTELVWQCSARVSCECQIIEKEADGYLNEPFRRLYVEDLLGEGKRFNWRRIVVEYTQRDLSQRADRLPAISGFATAMSKTSPHIFASKDYFFGLWRTDIVTNLLWNVVSDKDNSCSECWLRESTRFIGRYAPTWSWASVTGRIVYIDEVEGTSRYSSRDRTKLSPQVTLIRTEIDLDTENEYGPGFGELVVAGHLIPVTTQESLEHKFDVYHTRDLIDSQKSFAIAIPDVVSSQGKEVFHHKEYQWLIVAKMSHNGSTVDYGTRLVGLLLDRVPSLSGELYKRIGLVIGHMGTDLRTKMVQRQLSPGVCC
jgi:hypothetical protein